MKLVYPKVNDLAAIKSNPSLVPMNVLLKFTETNVAEPWNLQAKTNKVWSIEEHHRTPLDQQNRGAGKRIAGAELALQPANMDVISNDWVWSYLVP